jgi:hypothetical protein
VRDVAFVDRIADLFDEQHVAFALIGAAAVAARGVPRSTYDVDLLTVDTRVLGDEIWESIRALAEIQVRRGEFDDPLRGVVWIRPAKERSIDIVVGRWKWQQRVIERAEPTPSENRSLPTVTTADLILLKLAAGGAQDAWDIGRLLAVNHWNVVADVEQRLVDLRPDASDLWKRILSER